MVRFTKIFALALALTLGFTSLASAYSLGGFDKTGKDDWLYNYNVGGPWQQMQGDERLDWLSVNQADSFELFVVGGQSKYTTILNSKSGNVEVEFNSCKDCNDFDNMTKYYQNVLLDDLYFTRYNVYDRVMEDNDFVPLLTSHAVDHSVHPEGMIRNGMSMAIATSDMKWMDVEIKKGDILLGFDHYYDYVNGNHLPGESMSFTDMVIVLRGSGNPPAVPVPAAVWLLGTGMAGIAAMRRRMK